MGVRVAAWTVQLLEQQQDHYDGLVGFVQLCGPWIIFLLTESELYIIQTVNFKSFGVDLCGCLDTIVSLV